MEFCCCVYCVARILKEGYEGKDGSGEDGSLMCCNDHDKQKDVLAQKSTKVIFIEC